MHSLSNKIFFMTSITESLSGRTRIQRIQGPIPDVQPKNRRALPVFNDSEIPESTRSTHWVVKLHDPDRAMGAGNQVILYERKKA